MGGGLGLVVPVVMSGMDLEAGLLVTIVGEDFLERQDTGDGKGDLGDDQGLTGDGGEDLQADRSGDAHSGQEGGDQVAVVLVLLVATGRGGRILGLHVDAQGVGLEELVQLAQDGALGFAESAQRAGVGQQGDALVLGVSLLDQRNSVQQRDRFLKRTHKGVSYQRFLGHLETLKTLQGHSAHPQHELTMSIAREIAVKALPLRQPAKSCLSWQSS